MGNASSLKQHIETAEKTGTCNLSKQGITEFPGELGRLVKNLRNLDLSDNKLPSVPPMIGQFTMLKNLNLNQNRLCRLPDDIGNLKKLETLHVSHNRLDALPQTLNKLSSLRDVSFYGNVLTTFPVQLCGLKHLDLLDLGHNIVVSIPDEARNLEVIELNLNQNQVRRLSDEVAKCPRLKVLRLEENCLELSAFSPAILRDSNISLLALDGNLFDTKQFRDLEGYDQYMERFTATKKKL